MLSISIMLIHEINHRKLEKTGNLGAVIHSETLTTGRVKQEDLELQIFLRS